MNLCYLTNFRGEYLKSDVVAQCEKSDGNLANGELIAADCSILGRASGRGLGGRRW